VDLRRLRMLLREISNEDRWIFSRLEYLFK